MKTQLTEFDHVFRTLSFFERQQTLAFHNVDEICADPKHSVHEDLVTDLQSINEFDVRSFKQKHNYLFDRAGSDRDISVRKMYFENKIAEFVAMKRLRLLASFERGTRQPPGNRDDFADIDVDENGLISTRHLGSDHFSFFNKGVVYQLCPSLDQFNSSHWLGLLILKESVENGKTFRIRLDPLMAEPALTFRPYVALMQVYGKKLDWDRLRSLQADDHGQWLGDGLSTPSIQLTEYVWRPEGNEVHFTCEELPKIEQITKRGSRYLHAIFDKRTGNVVHCDGAIRIYDLDELILRQRYHVRRPEVRKIGKRVKLFRIDEEIDHALFMRLATNFLVWNTDAIRYFN